MTERDRQQQLQELISSPEEELHVEIKCWLDLQDHHRAVLAKEAMALANHGGGCIVLGFHNKGVPRQPATPRSSDLDDYN